MLWQSAETIDTFMSTMSTTDSSAFYQEVHPMIQTMRVGRRHVKAVLQAGNRFVSAWEQAKAIQDRTFLEDLGSASRVLEVSIFQIYLLK